jgi:hypothetical protein
MRFSEDDLLYAGNMQFLRNMKGCTFLAGKRTIYEVPGWIAERAKLADYMKKEGWVTVEHPEKKYKPEKCRNIILITGRTPFFIPPYDWKQGDAEVKSWFNLAVYFFLPKQCKIILVAVHSCLRCFTKPQQANIVSWFVDYLSKHSELDHVYIPLCLKEAGQLVGAPLGSMTHLEVYQVHFDSAEYARGFVYDEPKYQQLCLDVNAAILQATSATSRGLFFPECSNKHLLAYDCLTKTTNFILGFPLFTLREQGIRLIMFERHRNFDVAAEIKKKGGIPIECMRDFVVDDNLAYSIDNVGSFDFPQHERLQSPRLLPSSGGPRLHPRADAQRRTPHTRLLVILSSSRATG